MYVYSLSSPITFNLWQNNVIMKWYNDGIMILEVPPQVSLETCCVMQIAPRLWSEPSPMWIVSSSWGWKLPSLVVETWGIDRNLTAFGLNFEPTLCSNPRTTTSWTAWSMTSTHITCCGNLHRICKPTCLQRWWGWCVACRAAFHVQSMFKCFAEEHGHWIPALREKVDQRAHCDAQFHSHWKHYRCLVQASCWHCHQILFLFRFILYFDFWYILILEDVGNSFLVVGSEREITHFRLVYKMIKDFDNDNMRPRSHVV